MFILSKKHFFSNVFANLAMWDNLKNENITYFMYKPFGPVKFALIICKLGKKFLRGYFKSNLTAVHCLFTNQICMQKKKRMLYKPEAENM